MFHRYTYHDGLWPSHELGSGAESNGFLCIFDHPAGMLTVWKIVVRPDPELPDRAQGWALAETEAEALRPAGSDDAIAFPYPRKIWPGSEGCVVSWCNHPTMSS